MRSRHVVALVIGCLLALPGLGMLVGGAALAGAYAWGRDDAGYFSTSLRSVQTTTPAVVVSTDLGPVTEPWVAERFGVDIRVRVTPTDPARPLFVGVGPTEAVGTYLSGTAHDRILTVQNGAAAYTRVPGDDRIAPPTGQGFWVAQASGPGTPQLSWQPVGGRWTGVLMNADGSPGVDASVSAAVHAEFLLPLAWTLIGIGLLVTVLAALLIAYAVRHRRPGPPGTAGPGVVAPAAVGADQTGAMAAGAAPITLAMSPGTPVVMTAHLDPALSRAMWLVKWFLAIPHFIVLGFLWAAFGVTTIIAWFAILFTGSYPRGIFDFNVGVLRWTWRVSYYCGTGGLGTDRYPAFSLDPQPEDLATLDVVYPGQLSRGLIFVKWLLAFPHLIITSLLMGSGWRWSNEGWDRGWDTDWDTNWGGFGVLGLLVGVAAFILLFSGEYPKGLFDLVIGLNRWVYRVGAYVGLMTDEYPPFRLDSGEVERPAPPAPVGAPHVPPGLPPQASGAAPPPAAPPAAPPAPPPVAAPPEAPPPHGSPAPGMPPPDPREP